MKIHLSNTVTNQIQPLRSEIAKERTERIVAQTRQQQQYENLLGRVEVLEGRSIQRRGRDRGNEIVIKGFKLKSKAGAMAMTEKILKDIQGDPEIIHDRIANVPVVVPIRFKDSSSAEHLLQTHGREVTSFPGRFFTFWCNWSQTEAERQNFEEKYRHLFYLRSSVPSLRQRL